MIPANAKLKTYNDLVQSVHEWDGLGDEAHTSLESKLKAILEYPEIGHRCLEDKLEETQ